MVDALKSLLRKNRTTAAIIELYFLKKKYLTHSGWLESRFQSRPIDRDGMPIPWLTYSAIYYLNQVLTSDLSVFEYGSGHSTIWYSERVKFVNSIEHDEGYYNYVKDSLRSISNVELLHVPLSDAYINSIKSTNKTFDVIVIDGRERVQCSRIAIDYLTDSGVIIWDNSERLRYQPGIEKLMNSGFKKIDFMGHVPIGHSQSCTTVFYRDNNCLGI